MSKSQKGLIPQAISEFFLNGHPRKIPVIAGCPCGCTDRQVYRWYAHIAGHNPPSMLACEEFFHAVWAGES
jgi:hypothetical protein